MEGILCSIFVRTTSREFFFGNFVRTDRYQIQILLVHTLELRFGFFFFSLRRRRQTTTTKIFSDAVFLRNHVEPCRLFLFQSFDLKYKLHHHPYQRSCTSSQFHFSFTSFIRKTINRTTQHQSHHSNVINFISVISLQQVL